MFATFEGIEGSGKSTAIARLAMHLEAIGRQTLRTREPGGSSLGARLRGLLLDSREDIAPGAEFFLFLADRAQHVAHVIRPALDRGAIVLCDRFSDSTIAYQGYGRGMDLGALQAANALACGGLEPDITILLDLPVQCGLQRALARNRSQGIEESEGRFEREKLEFHERVRQGYLELAAAHPRRIVVVNAGNSPQRVFEDCLMAISTR